MPEPHCCVKNNCKGERYAELKLNCMYCGNQVYIQCMRERKNNEKIVKSVLKIFGLATSAHDGTFIVNTYDNEMLTKFNDTFTMDSPFAITCEVCSDKFKKVFNNQQQHQQNASSSPHSEPLLSVMALSHPHPEPSLSEMALPSNITNNQTDQFAIYISKCKPTTTCDKLAAYITHKTSLVNDTNFSVEILTKKSQKQHKLNFVSFKINASTKDDYDVIMNSDLWGSGVNAVPFVPPQKPPKPLRKKTNMDSKQKQKQQKVQPQQQQQQKFSSQNDKFYKNKQNQNNGTRFDHRNVDNYRNYNRVHHNNNFHGQNNYRNINGFNRSNHFVPYTPIFRHNYQDHQNFPYHYMNTDQFIRPQFQPQYQQQFQQHFQLPLQPPIQNQWQPQHYPTYQRQPFHHQFSQ